MAIRVLIISSFSKQNGGPRYSQTLGLVSLLKKEGVDYTLVSPDKERANDVQIIEKRKNLLVKALVKLNSFYQIEKDIQFFLSCITNLTQIKAQGKYDLVVCIVNPFTTGLFGVILVNTGVARKLVVDSGDPYSKHRRFKNKHGKLLRRMIEYYVSKRCNTFIVPVKESLADYPFRNDNFCICPQIFPGLSYHNLSYKCDNAVRIVFFGRFYESFRNPENFLYVLSKLKSKWQLRCSFYLLEDAPWVMRLIENYNLEGLVEIREAVSRDQMLSIIYESDICLNIENIGLNQVPSKMIDYNLGRSLVFNVGDNDPYFGIRAANERDEIFDKMDDVLSSRKYAFKSDYSHDLVYDKYLSLILDSSC